MHEECTSALSKTTQEQLWGVENQSGPTSLGAISSKMLSKVCQNNFL